MDGPGADIDRKVLALMLPGLDGRLAEQVLQLMPTWNDPLTSERLAELRNTLREHTDELRAGRPFVERCITGDADPADANDVAEAWHHSDRTVSLQHVLGLDDWEFEVWSRISSSARPSLIQVVVARWRSHQDHAVVPAAGGPGSTMNLAKADLGRANLGGANLREADLREAVLRRANLTGANLFHADLTGADLREADLRRANLTGADLGKADLTGAKLTGAFLTGADLTGAYFGEANLAGAYLGEANLAGAYLGEADLTGADLTGAYLGEAHLFLANLTVANLTGANLTGANLTGADLGKANLAGANLAGAFLTGADLAGAFLAGADLEGALFDDGTQLPAEIRALVLESSIRLDLEDPLVRQELRERGIAVTAGQALYRVRGLAEQDAAEPLIPRR